MWNEPTKKQLEVIPGLYETENIPLKDKIVYQHYFIFACDWFICEYDGNGLFWGYAILNGDDQNAEWGYISLEELKELNVNGFEIDRDIHWTPKPAYEVEKITKI